VSGSFSEMVGELVVVDIGTPMAGREEITSVLAVAGQMINMLTRRNTEVQLASLDDNDILVTPELGEVGTLDFEKYQTAYDRGYEAAIALRASLETLALDETAWDQYVASRPPRVDYDPPVEFIVIDNNSKISDELIRVRLNQQLGEPLDRKQLEQDIGEIYGLDYFESVDYELVTDAGNTGLVLKLREKTWGTDNFKLGLNLVNDLDGDSQFNIGVSYRQKGLNRLGAEWVARGQLGDTIILDSVFYQPIDYKSRFFVAPYLGYRDYDVSGFVPGESQFDDRALGSWRVRRARLELDGGVNLFRNSQLRLGLYRATGDSRIDIGPDELGEGGFDEGGAVTSYSYDSLDSAFFPTRGGFLYGEYAANRTRLGADEDFDRWQLQAIGALSFGAKGANTVIVSGRTAQSRNAANEPQNFNQLGGLFNMSGFVQNLASGKQMLFGMVQYQRRLTGQTLIPLSSPVYVGASLEQGNLWESRSEISTGDLRGAGSIYLAVDSPVGPVYVAYGRSGNAQQSIYLSLGWPFYSQDNSRR
jgi:NTE family protein